MNTIVVGVDGTRESLAALRFAMQEARLRGDTLKVVTSWHVPSSAYGSAFVPAAPDPLEFEHTASEALAQALELAYEQGVPAVGVLREGDPVHALVEESTDADQLVVGCHQFGRLRSLFHHSVSGHCAHDARCPVTVVHSSS
jgi:nucleotide-binding universal stress UspA family protein